MIDHKSERRVLVVHNPKSSHASNVQRDVFDRLREDGVKYESFSTPSPDATDNIDAIAATLREDDTVLSVGGDGTALQVANGVRVAGVAGVKLGILNLGNFGDGAHNFHIPAARRDPLPVLEAQDRTVAVRPLEIMVNDEYWRSTLLYATLGWTAMAAHQFDNPKIREQLQHGAANLPLTLGRLVLYYFKTRHEGVLPLFSRDGDDGGEPVTDIMAVSGRYVAGFMKMRHDKTGDLDFLSRDLDVSGLTKNSSFLTASTLGYMPGTMKASDTLLFKEPASVPIQLDGEFTLLENVSKLQIRKSPELPTLQVITTRR